jgi:hypothetical protein
VKLARQLSKLALPFTLKDLVPGLNTVVYSSAMTRTADWLDIAQVTLRLPHLPSAFDGYKLLQISDIHMGTGITQAILEQVVEWVNAESPDLVAITGDFVTIGSVQRQASSLIGPLRQLNPRDATLAVLGNHDHFTNPTEVRKILDQSGIPELCNDVYTLNRNGSSLNIAGIDDMVFKQGRLDAIVDKLPEDGGAILLAHEPDVADQSGPTRRFDLQLSGHSHGGQFILPLIGIPYLPDLGKKYISGQYQIDDMILYTSRGVGASAPAIRINCPPEITVFTLRSE